MPTVQAAAAESTSAVVEAETADAVNAAEAADAGAAGAAEAAHLDLRAVFHQLDVNNDQVWHSVHWSVRVHCLVLTANYSQC